jgi:3-oxoacyl-[acyl-carrier protein] reductase
MQSSLAGKVVVLTGAARGLGRDYSRYLAADGVHVVLADVKEVEAATLEATASGTECVGIEADVTSRDDCERLMQAAVDTFGRLDGLINNAGLWRGLHEVGLLNCPDEVWDAAWAVNVTGSLRCYQAAIPHMEKNHWGRIINISSMASRSGRDAYGLTKHAVEHMTKGMAHEVGAKGITVNCIAPGISAFEAAQGALNVADEVTSALAIQRIGRSRELYDALAYLLSDEASYVTGQTLFVDGGSGT